MSRFPAAEFPVVLPAGPGIWGYLAMPEGTPVCSLGVTGVELQKDTLDGLQ